MGPGMRRGKVLYKNLLSSIERPQDLKFIYTSLIPIRNKGKNHAGLNISNLSKNGRALKIIQDLPFHCTHPIKIALDSNFKKPQQR